MPYAAQQNHFDGSLRRLTKSIMAAITFFGLLLLAIIACVGWSANQAATEIERALVENAVNQRIERFLSEQKSVAWWDDAVVKIAANDKDFMETEFGLYLSETYGHHEVYILNGEGQPLYARINSESLDSNAFERRRPELEPVIREAQGGKSPLRARSNMLSEYQANYQVLAGVLNVAHWAGHIVSVDGRPAVVAAMTIVPNVDMTLLKGTPNLLVGVKFIDDAFISDIGRSLLLNNFVLRPEPLRSDSAASDQFVGDDGAKFGYLSWTTRRPGQMLLTIILPLVAFGVLATGLLSKTMFARLKRASAALSRSESQARHEAKHDALSGLPNRVHMIEKIEAFLHSPAAKRRGDRAVAAYIDVDRFKDINDTLGHEAGDQLIKAVAQRLKARLRPQDFLSRFGGDEFAILMPAGPEASTALTARVAQAFASPFSINDQRIRVTASVGLAMAPEDGTTADELMRHADIALYEAKNRGRDRAVLFSAEMAEKVERCRSIELDLRAALETRKLRLHYQPIVSCGTGAIVGVEALLRWWHPMYGDMEPAVFVPIAENSGLVPALGEWVLDQAMKDANRWPDLQVAVNLSPVQFRHVDLSAILRTLVAKHGVDPNRFVLEITENVLLEATNHTNSILAAVRAMGFKAALDDFGTGYSSLSYLCNFKFDKIKIDGSFVSKVSEDDTSRTIVQSVIRLGRGLGMDIVAEGVENESEAVMMTHFGCTELQGFYFSEALAADQMTKFLSSFQPKRFAQGPQSLHVVTSASAS